MASTTRTARREAIRRVIVAAVRPLVLWVMVNFVIRRHLGRISGLHNLPSSGPFMLISNHTSNFDQYLMGMLMQRTFRRDIKFLVKQEYLDGRFSRFKKPMFKEFGAMPFDRDNPDPVIMGEVLAHFAAGGVISIFPEGTRGDGVKLLPFMSGPFRLAAVAGVPIIPVGITGTQRILPKNRRYPRRGRATVVIGEPIAYQPGRAMRSHGLDHLVKCGRVSVDEVWKRARDSATDPEFGIQAAADAVLAAERLIDEAVETSDWTARRPKLVAARSMLWLARHNQRGHAAYQRDAAAVATMLAAKAKWPRNRVETVRARILGNAALLATPDDAATNYVMGTWHLQAPVPLGASRRRAVMLLEHAHEVAPADARIATALVEAYRVTGETEHASELLEGLPRAS